MRKWHYSNQVIKTLILASVSLLIFGCSGKTLVESDLGMSDAPDWVNQGTQYLNNNKGRLFHGVGEAPVMGDVSLQKSTADNRARAEVARILSSYLDVASQDYGAASGSGKDATAQQSVSREIKNLTKINLSGARIIGRWKDKKTGTIYSLAELDMKYVKQVMKNVRDMNQDLQRYINNNAENIFDKVSTR
ncbi:hypothetical protein MNBD_GAMMA24-1358 [hydrothermal vent metagenome]|uniref:Lipoprotein n=1 Tax=hydrothermal vent metagenome TaxID=652676 RepID=A0A3B1B3F0_9ZZZZ